VFQLSAFRNSCGEGCEWFADVAHILGGVLMVLVGLASMSLARRLFISFLTPGPGIEGRTGSQLIMRRPLTRPAPAPANTNIAN
jgi:hypothetical protein